MRGILWLCLSLILVFSIAAQGCWGPEVIEPPSLTLDDPPPKVDTPSDWDGSDEINSDIGPPSASDDWLKAISRTRQDEKSCSSTLYVDYLLTEPNFTIDYAVFKLDGAEWYTWFATIPQNPLHKELVKEVECNRVYKVDVEAGISSNIAKYTETSQKTVTVPPLNATLQYKLEEITGASSSAYKRYKLIVTFEASDLTRDENSRMTRVTLKGNGDTWSEATSGLEFDYKGSYQKDVTAGQVFELELFVTDAEGSEYTYSTTATVPASAYMLTVQCSDGGEVILSSPRGQYKVSPGRTDSGPVVPGTTVRLTAKAQTGYVFKGWGGNLTGDQNPASIVVNADKSIKAYFIAASEIDTPPAVCPVCGNPVNQCTCR